MPEELPAEKSIKKLKDNKSSKLPPNQ